MNETDIAQPQKLLLNAQHAFFISRDRWAMILTSVLMISAIARVISNLTAALAILKQKALRQSKDFLLIAFLSFFDFVQGVHLFSIFTFHYGTSFTRIRCLFTLRNITNIIGEHSSIMMLMLVSVDRLLAVSKPIWYFKQRIGYTFKLMAILLAFSSGLAVVEIYYPLSQPHEIVPYCLTTRTFLYGYEVQSYFGRLWLYGSVVLYILVIFVYRNHLQTNLNTVAPEGVQPNSREWKEYKKQLRSITVTMGISASITLLMSAVPISLWSTLRKTFPALQVFGWILLAPINLGTVANLFLYMKRQPEFMKALVALFKCQTLPENLRDWFAKKPAAHKTKTNSKVGAPHALVSVA